MEPVVVITGGTGGLGTALSQRLAASGARIAVTYLIPDEAERFEAALNVDEDRLMLSRVDANDSAGVAAFFQSVVDRFGHMNALCSLVGGWAGGRDIVETDDVRFDRMLDLNLRSAFVATRAAIPHLRQAEWGRIVLVGSRAALDTPSGQAAFNISKAGVMALGASAAQELGDSHVTANVVMPSVIDTPATRAALPYSDYVSWPTPDQIAAVISFLISRDSAVVSGAMVPVYGNS